MTTFRVVVADPAWEFGDKLPGPGRGAGKHYRVGGEAMLAGVLTAELDRLNATLADDCWLFCWRVSSQVALAYRILEAWGFEEWSEAVWRKIRKNGNVHMGMGRGIRNSHETAIIGRRGRPTPACRAVRSVFDAQMPRYLDGPKKGRVIHSAKPPEFYELVERLCGRRGPFLELFARARDGMERRPRWTYTGDSAPS